MYIYTYVYIYIYIYMHVHFFYIMHVKMWGLGFVRLSRLSPSEGMSLLA